MNSIERYEKIIDSLSREPVPLINILLSFRQLCEDVKDVCPEFVDKELRGYADDDELPSYRVISSVRIFADSQFILGGVDRHRSVPVSLQEVHLGRTENEYRECRGPLCEYQDLYAQGSVQAIVETLSDFETEYTTYTNVQVECRSADLARLLNAVRERITDAVYEVGARHPELRLHNQQAGAQNITNYLVNITGSSNQLAAGRSGVAQSQDN